VDKIILAIIDFSFGFYQGILSRYTVTEIKKSASMVYGIEKFDSLSEESLG
jgi:hypothetical protein